MKSNLAPPLNWTKKRKRGKTHFILTHGILTFALPMLVGWLVMRLCFFTEYNSYEFFGELITIFSGTLIWGCLRTQKQWNTHERQYASLNAAQTSASYNFDTGLPPAINDEAHYETAGLEVQNGSLLPGIWARAFAEADGDDNKTRAAYIRLRVAQLSHLEEEHRKTNVIQPVSPPEEPLVIAQMQKSATSTIFRRTFFTILSLIGGILTVSLAVCTIIAATQVSSPQRIPGCIMVGILCSICGVATQQSITLGKK